MSNKDFSFRRDFKLIKWKETIWLNFLRSAFAGPIWVLIMMLSGEMPLSQSLIYLLFPLLYLVGFLPLGLGAAFLSSLGVPVVGWIAFAIALAIVVGDPFVFILHKVKPEIVPIEKFNIMNFTIVMFVLDKDLEQ